MQPSFGFEIAGALAAQQRQFRSGVSPRRCFAGIGQQIGSGVWQRTGHHVFRWPTSETEVNFAFAASMVESYRTVGRPPQRNKVCNQRYSSANYFVSNIREPVRAHHVTTPDVALKL